MSKEKACLNCKTIYVGEKCPKCGEVIFTNTFKGRIYMFNPEQSEIAKQIKLNTKGEFAIKTK